MSGPGTSRNMGMYKWSPFSYAMRGLGAGLGAGYRYLSNRYGTRSMYPTKRKAPFRKFVRSLKHKNRSYVPRKIKPEKKYYDLDFSNNNGVVSPTNTSGAASPFHGYQLILFGGQIGGGTGVSDRIGIKIQALTLAWKLQFSYHSTGSNGTNPLFVSNTHVPQTVRFIVGYVKDNCDQTTTVSGGTISGPDITDLLSGGAWNNGLALGTKTNVLLPKNPLSRNNYVILRDKLIELDAGYLADTDMDIVKINKNICYTSTTSASDWTHITKNGIFVMILPMYYEVVGGVPVEARGLNWRGYFRLRYYDS